MTKRQQPRYPIYIISKGRHDCCLTARALVRDNIDFMLVIEPQEEELYNREFDHGVQLAVLPFSNLGFGSIPARNWVWEDAKAKGAKRHWILDDNIRGFRRRYKGRRVPAESGPCIAAAEDFVDRYTNVGIAGMNYSMFVRERDKHPPFVLNAHVYSCFLILTELPNRWRGRYNEDTDLCLQVLADGLCTVQFNAFLIDKVATMTMKGGNTTAYNQTQDARLQASRILQRSWPYVVDVGRRFDRPHHKVREEWRKFDTQLIRRTDIDWGAIGGAGNEYGMKLRQVGDVIKSPMLRKMLKEQNRK